MEKRFITVLTVGIIVLSFIVFFLRSGAVLRSVHSRVQDGINLSKKQAFTEAREKFNEALSVLKSQGYVYSPGDIIEFPSLLNEFKVKKQEPFMTLYSLLSDSLKNSIDALKKSEEITPEMELLFCKEMNKLIEGDLSKVFNLQDKNIFPEKINREVALIESGKYKSKKDRHFIHRLYMSSLFSPYFPSPLKPADIEFNIALTYHAQGDFKRSYEYMKTDLNKGSMNEKMYLLAARNLEKLNKMDEAVEILEKGIRFLPEDENLLNEAAYFKYKLGKPEAAKELIQQVLKINPKNKYAIEGMGVLERKQSTSLKNSSFYEKELSSKPDDLSLLSNLSLAFLKENKLENARETLSRGLKLFPDDHFLLKLMGRLEGINGKYREAVNLLEKASVHAKDSDPEIFVLLGLTYFNQQRLDEAHELLMKGYSLFPTDPYIVLNLAIILEAIPEEKKNASGYYEKYLELKPVAKNKVRIQKKIRELRGEK